MNTDYHDHDMAAEDRSENKDRRGKLFVVSAPSGAGKTTLCRTALNYFPNLIRSVSYTTRQPRQGERHGQDYFFIDEETFQRGIESGQWLEWARVHGNYYGTSADFVNSRLDEGNDIIMNIDVQGGEQILSRFDDSVGIFILPPSLEELKKRLLKRGQDKTADIEKRLIAAETEMARKHRYDHVLLNDDLEEATGRFISIIAGYQRQ